MGFAICRVPRCEKTGSQHYYLHCNLLTEKGIYIFIPDMWEHYMKEHKFLPDSRLHSLIMQISLDDPTLKGEWVQTRSVQPLQERKLLCVERDSITGEYDHRQGGIDYNFINHLKAILAKFTPYQTKGVISRIKAK